MNGKVKGALLFFVLCAVSLLTAGMSPAAFAAETTEILEYRTSEQEKTVTLYIRYAGNATTATVRIGGEMPMENIPVSTDVAPVTWLLLDNSKSIPYGLRAKAGELLRNIVGDRNEKEHFYLCTFSDHLRVELEDSGDYTDLIRGINQINAEYYDQKSYLADALYSIVTRAQKKEQYSRVFVISDGGDSTSPGMSMSELERELTNTNNNSNIPIYTVGCGEVNQPLRDMYSLSRVTKARSWDLNEIDPGDAAKIMHWEETPVRVEVPVSGSLMDGSVKMFQVTFSDGNSAEAAVKMAYGFEEPTPTPEPESPTETPTPVPPNPSPSPLKWAIPLAVVCLLAVCAALYYFLVWKKRRNPIESASSFTPPRQGSPSASNGTEYVRDGENGEGDGNTFHILQGEGHILRLNDLNNPQYRFERSLGTSVRIGRGGANQIVLNYDQSVSTNHCEISADGDRFFIQDLNSSNGTFVDGREIHGSCEISSGSTIQLGRLKFQVEIQ